MWAHPPISLKGTAMKSFATAPNLARTAVAAAIALVALLASTQPVTAGVDFLDVSDACAVGNCAPPTKQGEKATYTRVVKFCGLARAELPSVAFTMAEVPTAADLAFAVEFYADGACPTPEGGGAPLVPDSATSAASSSAAFSQSTLIWGAVDFLVGRAREEINTFVVERFTKKLCAASKDTKKIALVDLFPASCKVLADEDLLTEFMSGFTVLQAAFRTDIQGLPLALVAQIDDRIAAHEAPVPFRAVFFLARSVLGGERPLAALRALHDEAFFDRVKCDEVGASGLFVGAVAVGSAIADKGGELARVDGPEAHRYAALAFAVNLRDRAAAGNAVAKCVAHKASEVQAVIKNLEPLLASLDQLVNVGNDMRADVRTSAEIRLRQLARITSATIDLLIAADQTLAGVALPADLVTRLRLANVLVGYLADGEYGRLVLAIRDLAVELKGKDLLPKGFVRVVSFAVDYAMAKDVDAASAAIEAFAAPAGSYKGKRRSETSPYVKLNAYLGAGASFEEIDGKGGIAVGGYAPVGLEVGVPLGAGWSLGLLLQVVDLGALTTWRIKNLEADDKVDSRPEVGVEQIVSLGGALVLGIKDSPFAIALSVSQVPNLRLDSDDMLSPCAKGCDALRASLSFVVDIPILP